MGDAWYRILYLVCFPNAKKWYRLGIPNSLLVAAMISVKPLQTWVWGESQAPSAVENKAVSHVEFKKVKSEAELQQVLVENNKPLVMLDLYADWCVACKEFEKKHSVIKVYKSLW